MSVAAARESMNGTRRLLNVGAAHSTVLSTDYLVCNDDRGMVWKEKWKETIAQLLWQKLHLLLSFHFTAVQHTDIGDGQEDDEESAQKEE